MSHTYMHTTAYVESTHIVIPTVNHLLILCLSDRLRNGNVKHKHIFPSQCGSPDLIFPCLFF